jgi:hypothetical protein
VAISRVNTSKVSTNASSVSSQATPATSLTAGNLSVVFIRTSHPATLNTVVDTAGNVYTLATSYVAADPHLYVYYCENCAGHASNQVTVTLSAGQTFWWVMALQYSGVATAGSLDIAITVRDATALADIASASFSTAVPNELVLMAASVGGFSSFTAGADFTLIDGQIGTTNFFGGIEEYITRTKLSSYVAHFTNSAPGGGVGDTAIVVSFKPAAAGPSAGVKDTFTNTAGITLPTHSAKWAGYLTDVLVNHMKIAASGAGAGGVAAAYAGDYYTDSYGADQEVQVTVKALPTNGQSISLDARIAAPGLATTVTRYILAWAYNSGGADTWTMYKQVSGGSVSTLGSVTNALNDIAVNDKIRFRLKGTTLSALRYHSAGGTWIEVLNITDSSITAGGFTAMYVHESSSEVDDYVAGTIFPDPAAISATSTVAGALRRPFVPSAINATSTVSGAVGMPKSLIAASISATSSVQGYLSFPQPKNDKFDHTRRGEMFRGGSIVIDKFDHSRRGELVKYASIVFRSAPISPASISATSSVNGGLVVQRAVRPAAISATSAVSGNVVAQHKLPVAAISATSAVSGTVSKGTVKSLSGSISATSTVAGYASRIFKLVAASISATSVVSGYVGVRRRLVFAAIAATSSVTGAIVRSRAFQVSVITATSSVVGEIVARRRIATAAISATTTVGAAISKSGSIGDKFDHARRQEVFRGGGALDKFDRTRRGELPHFINLILIPAAKNVTPSDAIIAYAIVTGAIRKPQSPIGVAAISATSSVVGSLSKPSPLGDKFDHVRRGEVFRGGGTSVDQFNHLRRGEPVRFVNYPSSTSLRAVGGAITATSSVTAVVTKTGKLTPAAINATSVIAGALKRRSGIQPATIMATSFVGLLSGGTYGEGTYGSGIYGQGSSGNLPVIRAIRPAVIGATSSIIASGLGRGHIIQPNAILAVSIVTGTVGAARRPLAGAVAATSVVSGILTGRRGVFGSIIAASNVSGAIALGSGRVSTGTIIATSTVTGNLSILHTFVFGSINAKATVIGRVTVSHRFIFAAILATSSVHGVLPVSSQGYPGDFHRLLDTSDLPTGSLLATGAK